MLEMSFIEILLIITRIILQNTVKVSFSSEKIVSENIFGNLKLIQLQHLTTK